MSTRARSFAAVAGTLFVLTLGGSLVGVFYVARPQISRPPAAAPPTASLTPREIALRSFASVVLVSTTDASGKPLAFGSGFVVDPGVVVTNLHVLKGASAASVRLIGDADKAAVDGILASDEKVDLALLAAPKLSAAPLRIRDGDVAAIGDEVFVVGNPQDLEGTFSAGIVSGKRVLGNVRMLQITAPISGGSSGGPVLDGEARVVGVASSSLRGGQNLNFAVAAEYVSALLRSRGEVQEFAKITRPKAPESPRAFDRVPPVLRRLARLWPWR
jgi:S1-C subfamily serine protease